MTDPEGHPETPILEAVAARHEIFSDALLINPRDLSHWRYEAMVGIRAQLGWSYNRIGAYFGIDRATVIRAVQAART